MSATAFRNVALLGATGNLGSKILRALTSAGFNVTAIQRASSTNKVAQSTKSVKVDLSSHSQLTSAFHGQDVVVSAVPNPKLISERVWIDAAVSAGVERIVLSEFSTNLETKLSQQLPIVQDKVEIRSYAETLAATGKISWTSVNNGPFMVKYVWSNGWTGPNAKKKLTTYHDGGNRIVCTSTLERIAEGVEKALSAEHAAATRNKPVYVYSAAMSERRMTTLTAKAINAEPADFKERHVSVEAMTAAAFEAVGRGDMSKMMDFYVTFMYGEGYRGDFRDYAWNERFGLEELDEGDLVRLVKSWV